MVQKRTHVFLPEGLLSDIDQLFGKGPRFSRQIGITPILEPGQIRKLRDSIPVMREVRVPRKHGGGVKVEPNIKGLRDRAIIAHNGSTVSRLLTTVRNFCFLPR